MTVSEAELARLMPTVPRHEVSAFVRVVLGRRAARERLEIPTIDQLKGGLWEFMVAVGFVTDAQRRAVVDRALPALEALAAAIDRHEQPRQATVVFAEQRFLAVTGLPGWFDLHLEQWLPELPYPCVLFVVCELAALAARQQQWLAKIRGTKDGEPQHHAEAAEAGGGGHPPPGG